MRTTLCLLLLLFTIVDRAEAVRFSAYHGAFELDGSQQVPPVKTDSSGNCAVILQGSNLTLSCTTDLVNVTAVELRAGFVGEDGPVVVPLATETVVQQFVNLSQDQAARAIVGGLYVSIATASHPAGELRGQIRLLAVEGALSLTFSDSTSLDSGSNEDATLHCRVFALTEVTPRMRAVCIHNVEGPVSAHIHMGRPGEVGPIQFDFDQAESPLNQDFDLQKSELADLVSRDFYVDVHESEGSEEAVRAHFDGCASGNTTLCLRDRFVASITGVHPLTTETFQAIGRPLSVDSGTFYFFAAANKEVLIKVLDGCTVNDRFWVYFAATTDVKFDLTVEDSFTGQKRVYSNPPGIAAEPVTDTNAFDTCEVSAR